jgi:carboxypeptidase Taq
MTQTLAYDHVFAAYRRLHHLNHLGRVARWDQYTHMPSHAAQARAAALGELAALMHGMRTDSSLREAIERAELESLDDMQTANLREARVDWWRNNALPARLVEQRTVAQGLCEHAWRSSRVANDWKGFLPALREVVRLIREEASILSQVLGTSRYDAMLARHEVGMNSAKLDGLFAELKSWLPDLTRKVTAQQALRQDPKPQGPFPVDRQRQLCARVARAIGYVGRVDESGHPGSMGSPEDPRVTTHYVERDFIPGLLGLVHEVGHAMYEQHLPPGFLGQPVGLARSAGIHESQALSYEMQIGRCRAFASLISPWMNELFGRQDAFEPEPLYRWLTRVRPSLIRVEADEITYPAHVIVRYEIERALLDAEIEVDDIPDRWDHGMRTMLDLDTRGNHKDGALQDIHWCIGLYGYFPTYALGAMYAAQWFEAIEKDRPQWAVALREGDFAPTLDWLQAHVWAQGSRWSTEDLVLRASGRPLGVEALRRHLERRYLD